jgi:hypothetical protein
MGVAEVLVHISLRRAVSNTRFTTSDSNPPRPTSEAPSTLTVSSDDLIAALCVAGVAMRPMRTIGLRF